MTTSTEPSPRVGPRPDVVLMDIRMPNMDGLEAARHVLAQAPGCRVIMLTTFDLDSCVYAALAAGPAASCSRTSPRPISPPYAWSTPVMLPY
jgi:DNA-binding NarL/FixJ family response regulator